MLMFLKKLMRWPPKNKYPLSVFDMHHTGSYVLPSPVVFLKSKEGEMVVLQLGEDYTHDLGGFRFRFPFREGDEVLVHYGQVPCEYYRV